MYGGQRDGVGNAGDSANTHQVNVLTSRVASVNLTNRRQLQTVAVRLGVETGVELGQE